MSDSATEGPRPKRARRRNWEVKRNERTSEFPPGPSTINELFTWPRQLVRAIFKDEEMKLRLMTNLQRTTVMCSDYSGMDCPREAFDLVVQAVELETGVVFEQPPLKVGRTCDYGSLQQKVLLQVAAAGGNCTCHFGNIMDRLPLAARRHVEGSLPPAGSTKEQRKQAFSDISAWLHANSSWIFTDGATSWCMTHQQQCRVRPSSLASASQDDIMEQPGYEQPLQATVAGVTCTAWTQEGKQEQSSHDSEVYLSIWVEERAAMQKSMREDIFWGECTPRFPVANKITDKLHGTTVKTIIDGPEYHGWPHKRRRALWMGINDLTMRWVGPASWEEDYRSRFHRAAVLAGQDLFVSTDSERKRMYMQMAMARKNAVSESSMDNIDQARLMQLIFPPGCITRMAEWRAYFERALPEKQFGVCDVEHHPHTKGSCGGTDWPVQLTHGSVVAVGIQDGSWRLATPAEHLGALGFLAFDDLAEDKYRKSPLVDILLALSPTEVKVLCGNSMHLVTQAAFMVYTLSNVVKLHKESPRHIADDCWSSASEIDTGMHEANDIEDLPDDKVT